MNSNITEPNDSLQTGPQPGSAARAKTLRQPRFPEPATLTEWLTPPGVFKEPPEDQQEENIFDASLRALNQTRRRTDPVPDLKLVEFSVELPDAKTVQLAADFTDWEDAPVDMIRFDGGVWCITVPLPPGLYAYRFLADGEWYDDPRSIRRDPDAVDAPKAFVKVR